MNRNKKNSHRPDYVYEISDILRIPDLRSFSKIYNRATGKVPGGVTLFLELFVLMVEIDL